jgi:hypothetical protein
MFFNPKIYETGEFCRYYPLIYRSTAINGWFLLYIIPVIYIILAVMKSENEISLRWYLNKKFCCMLIDAANKLLKNPNLGKGGDISFNYTLPCFEVQSNGQI